MSVLVIALFLLNFIPLRNVCGDIVFSESDSEIQDTKRPRVAVLIPANPKMHPELKDIMNSNIYSMIDSNPELELRVFIDSGQIEVLPEDQRPLSKASRLRNRLLDSIPLSEYDHVLWLDADVVEYPPDLPTRLLQANPDGVTAPLVLIEEPGPLGPNQLYDTTAFTLKGRAGYRPEDRSPYVEGRSLSMFRPWVPGAPPDQELVEVDGVGTVYMMPARVFREGGARYEDHVALTEHWSVVRRAHELGMRVVVHRGVVARHANLPKYGEAWHDNERKPSAPRAG